MLITKKHRNEAEHALYLLAPRYYTYEQSLSVLEKLQFLFVLDDFSFDMLRIPIHEKILWAQIHWEADWIKYMGSVIICSRAHVEG